MFKNKFSIIKLFIYIEKSYNGEITLNLIINKDMENFFVHEEFN